MLLLKLGPQRYGLWGLLAGQKISRIFSLFSGVHKGHFYSC
jgi:hypothetical protein